MISENWAYVAAIVNLLGALIYVVDVFRGRARPNRVTWGVLTIAPVIVFASMMVQDVGFAQSSVVLSSGLGPFLIFLSSFVAKHPVWKLRRFDLLCGALSLVGLVLWWVTGEGNVAIVFSIAADFLAFLPTLVKAYFHPETESPWAFIISQAAIVLSLCTVKIWNFEHASFQLYLLCANAAAILLVYNKLGLAIEKYRHRLGLFAK